MNVRVVTDSAASLPPEVAAAHDVVVVPMGLTIGGRPYVDGELAMEEVVARLDEGVKTASPSPGKFAAALEGAESAVVLTVSHMMSATFDAAVLGARETDAEVRVVDTGTAAGAQGLVVLAAAQAARDGASIDEVERAARAAVDRVRLVATVGNLDWLARSGRVPGAAAWAGRWLGLNPMFEFRGGRPPRPLRPARSREAARARMVELWRRSQVPDARLHVAALHALADEPARKLLAEVSAEVEPATAFVGAFSPVMVAHTGPELVGLAWWWESEAD